MKDNVDLGFFGFPGCDVVCNRAVYEHGDYKTVAHISHAGNIKMFVGDDYLTDKDKERIHKHAERNRKEFISKLDSDIHYIENHPDNLYFIFRLYGKMYDCMSWNEARKFNNDKKGLSTIDKIKELKEIYISRS